MPTSPPAGYDDCESDAEDAVIISPRYREIDVPGVGILHARKPMPNAIPNLANAANSKISEQGRIDHLNRFIQNHLAPDEYEQLLARMMSPDDGEELPDDAVLRVSRSIATGGTARPTVPSSTSH